MLPVPVVVKERYLEVRDLKNHDVINVFSQAPPPSSLTKAEQAWLASTDD